MTPSCAGKTASRSGALILAVVLSAGCATLPDPSDPEAVAEFEQINDPVEPMNRGIFDFNLFFDHLLLKPIAGFYRDVAPAAVQRGVHNFLNNLRSPVIFFNDVLQGEMDRAGTTVVRLLINSTVGIAGFRDQAAEWGFPYHNEDFGQTLAVWTVPGGPYVMLPLFGPSNPRDTVGMVVDFFVDPLNWWAHDTGREYIIFARSGVRAVDLRARNFDALEDLEKSSLDFYAAIRSLYRQRRADEISNGETSARMPAPGISRFWDIAPAGGGKEISRVK